MTFEVPTTATGGSDHALKVLISVSVSRTDLTMIQHFRFLMNVPKNPRLLLHPPSTAAGAVHLVVSCHLQEMRKLDPLLILSWKNLWVMSCNKSWKAIKKGKSMLM